MTPPFFEEVATLYQNASSMKITRHRVEHPAFGKFSIVLSSFEKLLGELSPDDYWRRFLVALKRIRFDFCAAPFCLTDRMERISACSEDLRGHLRLSTQIYPDLSKNALALLDVFDDLIYQEDDPLLDKLLELTESQEITAWVIKESRLISSVERLISHLEIPNLVPLYPLQLKSLACYDRLIVVGPSRWFPESVFTAPRSRNIDIVMFDWIKDDWVPSKVFTRPHKSSGLQSRKFIDIEERQIPNRWAELDAMTLLQVINDVSSIPASLESEVQDKLDLVEAVCVLLENDLAVLFETGEGSETLVIDPDEEPDRRVSRLSTKSLLPGMFILVRTSGTGDYIIPIADRIMGSQASQARECQRHWKAMLRDQVRTQGLLEASVALLDYGSNIANEINVRNWLSPRSIRPHKYEDFLAIMKLAGLENQAEEYWRMMGVINRAHHKAGFEIKRQLLKQVGDMDMDELQKRGRADLKLSNDDEGGITALRVEAILDKTFQVPYSRLGHLLELEDQQWRA